MPAETKDKTKKEPSFVQNELGQTVYLKASEKPVQHPTCSNSLDFYEVYEYHRKAVYARIDTQVFTIFIPKDKGFLNISVIDGRKKKNEVSLVDGKFKCVSCTCAFYYEEELGTCSHIEAVKKAVREHKDILLPQLAEHHKKALESTRAIVFDTGIQEFLFYLDEQKVKIETFGCKRKTFDFSQTYKNVSYVEVVDLEQLLKARDSGRIFIPKGTLEYLKSSKFSYRNNYRNNDFKKEKQENLAKIQTNEYNISELLLDKKISLYEYQQEAVAHLLGVKRGVLALATGQGKTCCSITTYQILKNHLGKSSWLVVCPTSLKVQWKNEIKRFTGLDSFVVNGTKELEKYLALPNPQQTCPILIANYEIIARNIPTFSKFNFDVMVLDEVQKIRNNETKVWEGIANLNSEYLFALSATLLENRISDIYSIMNIIQPDFFKPKWKFDFNFTNLVGKTLISTGNKNIGLLNKKIQPFIYKASKDVFAKIKLPNVHFETVYTSLTQEQSDLESQCRHEAAKIMQAAMSRQLTFAEKAILQALLLKARQVSNAMQLVNKNSSSVSAKLDKIEEMVKDICITKKEKLVIFSEWTGMLNLINDRVLKPLGLDCVLYHGQIPAAKRPELVNKFVNDATKMIFMSTDAGGVGVDGLQHAAHYMIHCELPWNPAKLDQRNGRLHRMLQKHEVYITHIVSAAGIEQGIEDTLSSKRDMRERIIAREDEAINFDGTDESVQPTNETVMKTLQKLMNKK